MEQKGTVAKIMDWIEKVISFITIIGLIALVLLVFLNTMSRYFLDKSYSWTEEINRLLFLGICYLGMMLAFKNGQHVALNILTEGTHGKLNTFIKILRDIAIAAILVVLISGCYKNFMTSVRVSAVFRLSWKWFCGPMLISCIGMLILHIYQCYMRYVKHVEVNNYDAVAEETKAYLNETEAEAK